jgi:hypothetical protein
MDYNEHLWIIMNICGKMYLAIDGYLPMYLHNESYTTATRWLPQG